MNHDMTPPQKGASAFGFWAGMADIVSDPAAFCRGVSESVRDKFAGISRGLYSPPGENIKTPISENLETPVDALFREIAAEIKVTPLPFWPDGAPYAVCLTHDIDRLRFVSPVSALKPGRRNLPDAIRNVTAGLASERKPCNNLERIAQFEKAWGIRSALYVLFERKRFFRALLKAEPQHVLGVYDPDEISDTLRDMRSQGFEIGLHGSFDAYADARALAGEINRLGKLLRADDGQYGVRNHYLQFDIQNTPEIQKKCGVAYDSTLGFNFTCGFRCGTVFPFMLVYDKKASLVELPLSIMDTALRYSTPDREAEMAELVAEKTRGQGGLMMINWHQRFCNPETSPAMYNWVENTIARARREKAYIATPMEVARRCPARIYGCNR